MGGSLSKLESTGVATLGGVQISLTILEKLMDSFPLPFVKGLAGAGVEVIKMARVIDTNRKDCGELSKRSTELLVIISAQLQGKTPTEVPDDLQQRVVRLRSTFNGILEELRTVEKRVGKKSVVGFRRVVFHYDNAETLKGCCSKLDWAMQEFQVTSQIDSCLRAVERHQEVKSDLTELRQGQNEILELVKEKAVEKALSSLPSTFMPSNPIIFGRDDYVAAAVKLLLAGESAQLAILGPGGIGKTSVALKVAHNEEIVRRFGSQNIYWAPCEAATKYPLLIELLANTLELPTPSPSRDRFRDIVTFLKSSGGSHLLLLDNFETPWDIPHQQSHVKDILVHLANIPSVSIILTMRGTRHPAKGDIAWAQLPCLPRLELPAAREAFLRIAPTAADDTEFDSLLKELDFMPLAIKLAASIEGTPSELLRRWRSEKTTLLTSTNGDHVNCIEVCIGLSLKSPSVEANPDAIALLSVLSVLPAGACRNYIQDICPSINLWERALSILNTAALVDYNGPDRAFVHVLSPIRAYMLLHHPLPTTLLHDLQTSYCTLSRKGGYGPNDDGFLESVKELSREQANIEVVLNGMLDNESIIQEEALQASLDYSTYCKWTLHQTTIMEKAVNVAEASRSKLLPRCLMLHADLLMMQDQYDKARTSLNAARDQFITTNDLLGAARCLRSLGTILRMQTRYEEAITAFSDAKDQFNALGNQLGAAECLQSLGQILRLQDKYDEARSALSTAGDQFKELGNHLGATQCLRALGDILQIQCKYAEAKATYEIAKDQFSKLGYQLGVIQCLQALGDILLAQNLYDEAKSALNEAKDQFIERGDRLGTAQCLQSLGSILYLQDQYDEADEVLNEAKNLFQLLENQLGFAHCLQSLGDILQMRQNYAEARTAFNDAQSLYTKLGSQLGAAQCLQSLGNILCAENEYDQARTALNEARTRFIQLGNRQSNAQCLQSLGAIMYMEGEYDGAIETLNEARKVFTTLGYKLGDAQCLRLLGEVLQMQFKRNEAIAYFDEAREQFKKLGDQLSTAQCLKSIGMNQGMKGNIDEARTALEDARALFIALGVPLGAAQCLNFLGISLRAKEKYDEAKAAFQKAVAEFIVLGYPLGAARCQKSLEAVESFRIMQMELYLRELPYYDNE